MKDKVSSASAGFLAGVIAGSCLSYLLDPDHCGQRRQAVTRDKAIRAEDALGEFADQTARDLQNHTRGIVSEALAAISEREVPDEVLERRV